jgi:hypothetical protein
MQRLKVVAHLYKTSRPLDETVESMGDRLRERVAKFTELPQQPDPSPTGGWFFRTTVETLDGRKLLLTRRPFEQSNGLSACRLAGSVVAHATTQLGTHAALFGVDPWRLRAWLGHKRIDERQNFATR